MSRHSVGLSQVRRSQGRRQKARGSSSRASGQPAKKKSRRTQEERSRETRGKLLAAACKLLVERGYGYVTVDDISAAAGLTNGARVYQFGTKLELMVALWEHLREKLDEASDLALADADKASNPLDSFLDWHFRLLRDPTAIAFYELINGSRADPALDRCIRRSVKSCRVKAESSWVKVLGRQGYDSHEAAWIMRTTIVLLRGLVNDLFIGSNPKRLQETVQFWRERIAGPQGNSAL
jgi:AcrR family transcriptional regulator